MKRWRTAITLAVLLAVFIVGSLVGFRLLFTKVPPLPNDKTTTSSVCQPRTIKSGGRLSIAQVTVNVFNASSTSGLANRTLINIAKRGFRAGTVANAPKGVTAYSVTILTKDRTSPSVRLVAKQFKGYVRYIVPRTTLPTGVQVVVGQHYRGLRKHKWPRAITANKATRVCIQLDNSDSTK